MSDQHVAPSTSTEDQTSTSTSTAQVCAQCGGSIPARAPGEISSPYAIRPDNSIICLDCAAKFDTDRLARGEDVTLYVFRQKTGAYAGNLALGNWPGRIFVEVFQRVTTSKHTVFGKTRTQRTDYYFKYGAWEYHGVNIGDNDLVHCKARKLPAPAPKRAHYIALGGLSGGYMPNFCEVFETKTGAAQYIADLHELSHRAMLRLRRDMSIDLDLESHGNEYGEIQVCYCDDPSVHSDSAGGM